MLNQPINPNLKAWDLEARQHEKRVYFNKPQLMAQYIGAKTTVIVAGRRTGKTDSIASPSRTPKRISWTWMATSKTVDISEKCTNKFGISHTYSYLCCAF